MNAHRPCSAIRHIGGLLLVCTLLITACGAPAPATQPTATANAPATTSTPMPIATDTPVAIETLPPPADDSNAATRLASTILNTNDTTAMVEVLARVGVFTVADTRGNAVQQVNGTPSVISFTTAQVSNMAREANARMGTRGADLDALAPTKDVPPLSYILASYVLDAQTFGATFSRTLLGTAPLTDPPQILFPTVVLTLFLADVLAPPTAQTSGVQLVSFKQADVQARPVPVAAKMAPAGICGAMTGALENVLERILSSVLGSFIGSIVAGAAVRYGMEYLSDALSNLPIIRQIRQALAVVAMVAQFGSLLRNWSVQLSSDGATYHYADGGGSPSNGIFTATVDAGGTMRVPPAVKECAALARITLPEISGAEGSQVVWTPGAGWGTHASETNKETVVAADQTAKLNFGTASETELDHSNGTTIQHPVSMNVSIRRNDVAQVRNVIARAVNDLIGIPGIGGLVQDVVGSGVDALADTLMNPQAQATIAVESEVHPWSARYTQPGSCGGLLTLEANSCAGLAGPWTLVVVCSGQINGSDTTNFAFDASSSSPPPVDVEWHLKGNSMHGMLTTGTTCDDSGCLTVTEPVDGVFHLRHVDKDGHVFEYEMGRENDGKDVNIDWFGTATLLSGPILHAQGATSVSGYMGMGASSSDSVDFSLVPRPDQPLCTQ